MYTLIYLTDDVGFDISTTLDAKSAIAEFDALAKGDFKPCWIFLYRPNGSLMRRYVGN